MNKYLILSLAVGVLLLVLERLFSARPLPIVKGWWARVVILNVIQAAIVFGIGDLWRDKIFVHSVFNTSDWGLWPSAFFAYFIITFIFYWWHRWRHEIYFLWITMHQIHHSPQRIETITSFYKHPVEIFLNSIIISAAIYGLLGLTPEAGAALSFLTCIGEFLYHMNLKTPYWWGFVFQRPESHRIHHKRGYHFKNFGDLPIWDILFGTFYNPKDEVECGFHPDREEKFVSMLVFKDVNQPRKGRKL